MKSVRKVTRVTLACVVAGMLSFGALGVPAGAAGATTFNAKSSAFALRVTVDLQGLPTAVKAQIDSAYAAARAALPANELASVPATFPYSLDQKFLTTSSNASNAVTTALSKLGVGTFELPEVSATNVGDDKTSSLQTIALPPVNDALNVSAINAGVGTLRASVAAGPKVDSDTSLASVSATLANLNAMLPPEVAAALQTILNTVNTTIANPNSTLNSALNGVTDQVNTMLAGNTVPGTPLNALTNDPAVAGALTTIEMAVGSTIPDIEFPQIPNMLQVTPLATVNALKSQALSQRTVDGRTVSDSSAQLASVNLLGGLFSTGLIDVRSHSENSGTPGSAKNTAYCSVADARIGSLAGVALDGSKIYVNVNGAPVAVPVVGDAIPLVKSQLDGVLAAAGISIQSCDAASGEAAANGTSARQSVSAFKITIEPKVSQVTDLLGSTIPAGQPLGVKVIIDPTVTTEVQTTLAVAAVQLPRTGAANGLTIGVGAALMAAAVVLRRRAVRVRVRVK